MECSLRSFFEWVITIGLGAFMMLRGTGNIVGNPLGSILLTTPSNAQSGWNEVTYLVGSFLLLSAAFGGLRGILAKQTLT